MADKKKTSGRFVSAMSIVSMVLGIISLVTGITYLVFRFISDCAYQAKWKDYEECGMM